MLNVLLNVLQGKKEKKQMEPLIITLEPVQKKPVTVEACQLTQEIWNQIFEQTSNQQTHVGEYAVGALRVNDEMYFLIEMMRIKKWE